MSLSQSQATPVSGTRSTSQPLTPLADLSRHSHAVMNMIGRLPDSPDRRPTNPTFNSAV
ncbi:hypothetical protein STRTUCAR8_03512 [Streptomyces turgidiscabies Car8]|uniref:FXSXX-COOH protein n=1 Tax=Streptomyces turgidiscabies (strain Car8) TaxID=698760 RepID=L7FBM8_STRT8|nr:hypothetical protein STRTUCAR8_03512 [Streptomyces turgidiscabies Car8]GAQ68483.1 hypothetical protein T45_00194 [Streptomyces turgidiscabies]